MSAGELSRADLHYNEAVGHMRAGDHEAALAGFDSALAEDPDHARAQLARPRTLSAMGRLDEAVEALKAVVGRRPTDAAAFNDLGMVYRQLQEAEGALWCFRAAVRLSDASSDYFYNLARTYWDVGRYPEAAEAFRKLIERRPEDVEAHHEMADLCFVLGAYDEAHRHVTACLLLAPDSPHALQWQAKLQYLSREELEEARS